MQVLGAFGDDDEVEAPADGPSRGEGAAHGLFPVVGVGWTLGDQHPVGAGRQGAHERQIAAVAPHHLDDEGTLVAGRSAVDGIDGFGDAMESRVGADGHVGPEHVVVDRADQANQGEAPMGVGRGLTDLARVDQLAEQGGPFLAEEVGTGQAAVASDDYQGIDAPVNQIAGRPSSAFSVRKSAQRAVPRTVPPW